MDNQNPDDDDDDIDSEFSLKALLSDSMRKSKGGDLPDLQFVHLRMNEAVKALQSWGVLGVKCGRWVPIFVGKGGGADLLVGLAGREATSYSS